MQSICWQVHLGRAPALTSDAAAECLARVGAHSDEVRQFVVLKGRGRITVLFEGRSAAVMWDQLRSRGLEHRSMGRLLRRSSVVFLKGRRGWKDHRMLFRFAPTGGARQGSRVKRRKEQ